MRASDLLGREVVDVGGVRIGVVMDLRCVQTGSSAGGGPALRVESLVVSRHRTGAPLGYLRSEQNGPWLVRVLIRALHRRTAVVAWGEVEGWEQNDDRITLRR